MSQFDTLDDMIKRRLADGALYLVNLNARDVRQESERLEALTGREAFRVLDARLQALRKKGAICFSSRVGWSIAASSPNAN